MTTLTATLTTGAMLVVSLLVFALSQRSLCQSLNWRTSVSAVGEGLKTKSKNSRALPGCRGGQVHWSFTGSLYAQ